MIKVIVNGARGRMGQEAVKAIQQQPTLQLIAETGKNDTLADVIHKFEAQVVVDFTTPKNVYDTTQIILQAGAHPVVGTTGFTPEQISALQQQCLTLKRGAIIAPNFSIAAVLMMKAAVQIAAYYPHAEIIELHHEKKLDAPSGTACKTAELIQQARSQPAAETVSPESRGKLYCGIPIHSVRLPGIVANQEVIFGGEGETLRIRHDTISRSCFMPGVILSINKVINLTQLVYGLENLI